MDVSSPWGSFLDRKISPHDTGRQALPLTDGWVPMYSKEVPGRQGL